MMKLVLIFTIVVLVTACQQSVQNNYRKPTSSLIYADKWSDLSKQVGGIVLKTNLMKPISVKNHTF